MSVTTKVHRITYSVGFEPFVKKPIMTYAPDRHRGGKIRERVKQRDMKLPNAPKAKIKRIAWIKPSLNDQTFVTSKKSQPNTRSTMADAMQKRRVISLCCHLDEVSATGRKRNVHGFVIGCSPALRLLSSRSGSSVPATTDDE